MDDIQFWLYLAFAVIYFITRGMKKKTTGGNPKPSSSDTNSDDRPQRKPVSFEDLLKEFTEGREVSGEENETMAPSPPPVEARHIVEQRKWQEKNTAESFKNEGRHRQFADDESRRIYENSIKIAEKTDLSIKGDDAFKSKLKRFDQEEEDIYENDTAISIREMLQDSDDAKKAIILSEILNRKY